MKNIFIMMFLNILNVIYQVWSSRKNISKLCWNLKDWPFLYFEISQWLFVTFFSIFNLFSWFFFKKSPWRCDGFVDPSKEKLFLHFGVGFIERDMETFLSISNNYCDQNLSVSFFFFFRNGKKPGKIIRNNKTHFSSMRRTQTIEAIVWKF